MLSQLSIYHLRNLQAVTLPLAQCNVFIGPNGSGKTSLLESLYLLSRGKSFRHYQPKRYISHHAPHATVHAKFVDGNSMAIQKSQDASTALRLSQQTVYVQSALTKQLPTLLIDPSSMDILEVGSSSRRQMLDWITFHVKPGFHPQWMAYQRLLKQRNAILKQSQYLSGAQKSELAAWDKGLATHAALITHYRRQAFEAWQPLFEQLLAQLLPEYAPYIQLRFSPGYNTELELDQLLQQRLTQDHQAGYTRIGCHRADIQVLWVDNKETRREASIQKHMTQHESQDDINNHDSYDEVVADRQDDPMEVQGSVREQAANVLSRGEKKLLITALRLSQLPLLADTPITDSESDSTSGQETSGWGSQKKDTLLSALPVVLLDDITAELDERALDILLTTLSKLSCQVFITSLDASILPKIESLWPHVSMFHVKQGSVQLIESSDK